jgi:hypothetical protein
MFSSGSNKKRVPLPDAGEQMLDTRYWMLESGRVKQIEGNPTTTALLNWHSVWPSET